MRGKLETGIFILLLVVLFWSSAISMLYTALYVEHNNVAILIDSVVGVLFLVASICLSLVIAYFVGEGIDK